jgi:sorbose reductase
MVLYQPTNKSVRSLFDLTGKVSAVTGGTRGIGYAAAQGLAEAGSDIALIYYSSSQKSVDEVATKLAQDTGVRVRTYQADVRNKSQITQVIEKIAEDLGRLDIVVPNSGVAIYGAGEDFSEATYRDTLGVNLDGAFFTAQAAANVFKRLVEAETIRQGSIVFTASVSSGIVNYPQKQAPYNASKAGLVQLAKCLAVEWVDFARVNCVSPGYIQTELLDTQPQEWRDKWFAMIPSERMAQTYEMKGTYVYLASDASSYTTGAEVIAGGAVSRTQFVFPTLGRVCVNQLYFQFTLT